MILGDTTIRRYIRQGWLVISPFDDRYVRSNSYDFHLHKDLLVPNLDIQEVIEPDTNSKKLWSSWDLSQTPWIIDPGEIALGRTLEHFEFPRCGGKLEGVSSLGRIFLSVHNTAGYFDYGFHGTATVEIKNNSPWRIRLREGMRIGQMSFEEVSEPVELPYRGRYYGQVDPTPTKANSSRSS